MHFVFPLFLIVFYFQISGNHMHNSTPKTDTPSKEDELSDSGYSVLSSNCKKRLFFSGKSETRKNKKVKLCKALDENDLKKNF